MGQIHGPDLGAPAANVTSSNELVTTGSMSLTDLGQDQATIIARENGEILNKLLKEAQKINFQLQSMNDIQIKNEDV